jgi:hypothetical protein
MIIFKLKLFLVFLDKVLLFFKKKVSKLYFLNQNRKWNSEAKERRGEIYFLFLTFQFSWLECYSIYPFL